MRNEKVNALALPDGRDAAPQGPAWRTDRRIAEGLLAALGHPPVALRLWDGSRVGAPESAGVADVVVRTRGALLRLLINPELYFGDDYATGLIDVEGDLVRFLKVVYGHMEEAGALYQRLAKLVRPRQNTLKGSRYHIRHHYDLGNDFYRLWLDEQMVYTCAYFPSDRLDLEAAQVAKMDHVCRKLRLRPGDTVVEAGCGWGSLARHMALRYGATVKAYNISEEQVQFARERAQREGFADRVEYILEDYRNIAGRFDAFVSIGMLEHVGADHYGSLGAVIDRALARAGRGLIHTIGRNSPAPMNAWIEKRIFPGAYPPSLCEMMQIFEPWSFSILDVENLRLHYARTLGHWLDRFDSRAEQIEKMYDTQFVRAWRLYLAGSLAAFAAGSLQLFQVLFARPRNNDLPMSREHLYL